jgi:hypothetical protein
MTKTSKHRTKQPKQKEASTTARPKPPSIHPGTSKSAQVATYISIGLALISLIALKQLSPRLSGAQAPSDPKVSIQDELSSSQFTITNDGVFAVTDVVAACYVRGVDETEGPQPGPAIHLRDWVSVIVRPLNNNLNPTESFTVPCTSKRFFGMPVSVTNGDIAIVVYYCPWPFTVLRLHRLFRFTARRGDQGQLIWDKQPSAPVEDEFDKWVETNGGTFPPPHKPRE